MEQKLVFINLDESICSFYNIKIEKNSSEYYLIVSSGKIGNKGKVSIVYRGKNYSECKKEFWDRVNEKKLLKYKKLEEVSNEINKIFSDTEHKYVCGICQKELNKTLYSKINNYLRKETEVDSDKENPLYKKIACFECQSKLGIYKGKNKNLEG